MDDLFGIVLFGGCIFVVATAWLAAHVNVLSEENKALRRHLADERTHITLIDVNDKRHLELVAKNAREEVISE